jgi:anti-sigma regulatory factor (Ser/Thr protein kinase)
VTTTARPAAAIEVPAEVAAVPRARAEALRWLTACGPDRSATEADVVAVATAVTELVANAVTHGAPPVRLELEETAGAVSVTVTDGGRGDPRGAVGVPRALVADASPPEAVSGRGLVLVRDVVDELTVTSEGAGTRARAVRRLGDPPT